jgi:type 1 glutamine amidotransferase
MKSLLACLCLTTLGLVASPALGAGTRIVLIAGNPSHGPGEHEFNAGTLLLEKWLRSLPGIEPVVVKGGWPRPEEEEKVFQGAKAVMFYMDGGDGHPMIQGKRMGTMKALMDRGVGLVCIHYAVEFPKGKVGDQILSWLGGYYETGYSKNPHNTLEVTPAAPSHPISRGLKPYSGLDEWYYFIRFKPGDPRVTPILTAQIPKVPERQTLAWATERENGGRSFGFTGAHFHRNWAIPEFRRMVLNAILWSAGLEVPEGGVQSQVSDEELAKNLDEKGPRKKK